MRHTRHLCVDIPLASKAFELYNPSNKPVLPLPTSASISAEACKDLYYRMHYIRRMELLSDVSFKKRLIRGFCHLYTGQEAIATGMNLALDLNDAIVTAYRCHAWYCLRGGNAYKVFAEMFGRRTGASGGKGGSMHLYNAKANFWGGNGIVGAQVPLGVGLGLKYALARDQCGASKASHCSVALYGDGAANQGQIFEAFNMAALWKVPTLFVCENNHFGMGTSAKRASANPNFFQRCEYIPGLKIDGMDPLAVMEGTRWAKEYALSHGPVIIEMDSYRYVGHSMSDPGTTYRQRGDVDQVRNERDCITRTKGYLLEYNLATEEEITNLEKRAKDIIDGELARAHEDPEPDAKELSTDIYSYAASERPIPIKSCQGTVDLFFTSSSTHTSSINK